MSLVGFKAQNHEQQVARRGALDIFGTSKVLCAKGHPATMYEDRSVFCLSCFLEARKP